MNSRGEPTIPSCEHAMGKVMPSVLPTPSGASGTSGSIPIRVNVGEVECVLKYEYLTIQEEMDQVTMCTSGQPINYMDPDSPSKWRRVYGPDGEHRWEAMPADRPRSPPVPPLPGTICASCNRPARLFVGSTWGTQRYGDAFCCDLCPETDGRHHRQECEADARRVRLQMLALHAQAPHHTTTAAPSPPHPTLPPRPTPDQNAATLQALLESLRVRAAEPAPVPPPLPARVPTSPWPPVPPLPQTPDHSTPPPLPALPTPSQANDGVATMVAALAQVVLTRGACECCPRVASEQITTPQGQAIEVCCVMCFNSGGQHHSIECDMRSTSDGSYTPPGFASDDDEGGGGATGNSQTQPSPGTEGTRRAGGASMASGDNRNSRSTETETFLPCIMHLWCFFEFISSPPYLEDTILLFCFSSSS